MTYEQIHNLFKQGYNQKNWKQFLGEAFANSSLLATPEILTGIDSNVASQVQKLGYITLNENGIERQITVYEVTLAQGIVLERNRVGLRNLLRKYWKDIDAAFIAYYRPETPNWRFTYVSELTGYDVDGEFVKIKTEPKRYTYVLGEGESTRTAAERFTAIANKGSNATLDDVKEAFSVEKLSKAFFDEYKKHYDIFCKFMVSKPNIRQSIFNGDEKGIRDFNKKLLGRIVFLYFIQKKGWLGVPIKEDWGKGDFDFLTNLFKNTKNPDLFYSELLSKLFFDTLNTKRKDDLIELVKGEPCRIPYLNGGLFEEDDKKHRNLIFPANLFKNLFDFFNQYNFTIYEDDPNDHTVAVDPEMLGHIFENLLEDNKDKGAYYTPKEIVHYMCQESLIEYLKNSPPLEGWQTKSDGVVNFAIQTKSDKVVKRGSKNYFKLPYNPKLKERARELRKAGNLPEVLFWKEVKNKQFKGYDFDRQKIVGNYIVDFYCTNCNVVIEIDGSSHDDKQEYDAERDAYLQSLGLQVIHIPVNDVMKNMNGVMDMLFNHPALSGTPPKEGNYPTQNPPKDENLSQSNLTEIQNWEKKVNQLIKQKDASLLNNNEIKNINTALDHVKICDPAIGSGAFPMGLLHEIFTAKQTLHHFEFPSKGGLPAGQGGFDASAVKLNIIQNSIYGVDIEKGAVDIARLRFWLSLIVDEAEPKALPNLDYKIVVGNSLVSMFEDYLLTINWAIKDNVGKAGEFVKKLKIALQKLAKMQKEYFDAANKTTLKQDIRNLKIDILLNQVGFDKEVFAAKNHKKLDMGFGLDPKEIKRNLEIKLGLAGYNNTLTKLKQLKDKHVLPLHFFDWKLDFPEVMNEQVTTKVGFDIVIANPPYIKEYTNRDAFEGFRHSPYYQGKMDIWYGFACKMLDLLKPKGIECFIAQNNWITSAGASIFREKVLTESEIRIFTDFGNYKVFETAGIQTMIYVLQKATPKNKYELKYSVLQNDNIGKAELIEFLIFAENDSNSEKFLFNLNPSAIKGKPFTFNNNTASDILDRIKLKGNLYLTEKEVAQGIVFPQDFVNKKSKEKLTNTVDVGDGIFALSKSELKELELESNERKLIKPSFTTAELSRYYANPKNKLWIIYTGSEFKNAKAIQPYPNLKKHLDRFKNVITSDNRPYGLHRAREERFFIGESIVAQRKCPNRPSFTYTDFNCYVSATFYVIQTSRLNMKYLTGLLNSKLVAYWLRNKGKMQGNNYQIDKGPILAIPLIKPNDKFSKSIEKIVIKILDKKSQGRDTTTLEQEIDNLVYKLYELTYDEVKVIDSEFSLSKTAYESIILE